MRTGVGVRALNRLCGHREPLRVAWFVHKASQESQLRRTVGRAVAGQPENLTVSEPWYSQSFTFLRTLATAARLSSPERR